MVDLYKIWLCSVLKIPARYTKMLYDYFGGYEEIYKTSFDNPEEFFIDIPPKILEKLRNKDLGESEDILKKCIRNEIRVCTYTDSAYPTLLKEIQGAPQILYYKGRLIENDEVGIAIVGSRKPTVYGERNAKNLGENLAKAGAVVVSGMARGIDSAAHRGCLQSGGRTIAVLGCGVDIIYPPENAKLRNTILENGCIVSEFPPETQAYAKHFPARNRIISGISRGVVIVEGKASSGSTITADFALAQGRDVFGIPGSIDNPLSAAPHKLIREGAKLITSADDIIEDMAIYFKDSVSVVKKEKSNKPACDLSVLSNEEKIIYELTDYNRPVHIDILCEKSELGIAVVNQCLLMLEIQGFVQQLPNKYFIRLK